MVDVKQGSIWKQDNEILHKHRSTKDELIEQQRESLERQAKLEESKEYFFKVIGNNLKREFENQGMSYRKLSDFTNISESHCCRIIKGTANVGLDTLFKIAYAFDKDPAEFLPTYNSKSKTNGQIYEELTKELDPMSNRILLDWISSYVKEYRRQHGI